VGHTLRSSGLLHVEASRTGASKSDLKTGAGVTMDGAHDIIMKVASR
jgi:hypothetical protein